MRVAVNLLWLVPGVVGGTEGYATSLLRAVAARGEIDLLLVVLPDFAAAYPDLVADLPTLVAPLPPGRRVVRRVALEQTWLPTRLRRAKVDLSHHLGGTLPVGTPHPSVLTVHDLQYRHFPQYFSRAKLAYLTAITRQGLAQADLVTTVSEFSAHDLETRCGLTAGSVRVVPPVLAAPGAVGALPSGLPTGPYVVYPAATYRHKNHAVLLDAVARTPGLHLVLTGASGAGLWGSAGDASADLDAQVARLGIGDRVHRLGLLPREQYRAVLAAAAALAFPSAFEGYGLPVVEAFDAGVPVLAADTTALPEVVGDGGRLLDPAAPGAWADALAAVLADPSSLREAAGRRAQQLHRVDPAALMVQAYREVAR